MVLETQEHQSIQNKYSLPIVSNYGKRVFQKLNIKISNRYYMKHFNKLFLLFLALFALVGCDEDEPEVNVGSVRTYTMVEALEVIPSGDYTLLARAIRHAGLETTVNTTEGITVFAPNNAAFNVLLSELGVATVEDIDATTLSNILQYHVAGQALSSAALGTEITSLEGSALYVTTAASGGVNLNGKSIIEVTDRQATNGVFHGIGSVLEIPYANSTFAFLQSRAEFSTLVAAITKAGLQSSFEGSTDLTIFAPTNDAFTAAGIDVANTDAAILEEVLKFHVLSGRRYSQTISLGSSLETLLGSTENDSTIQEIQVGDNELSFQGVVPDSINISTSNGVVHRVSSIVDFSITLLDGVGTAVDVTGFDQFGVDDFGSLITQSGVTYFTDLRKSYALYVPFLGTPPALADAAEAKKFVERHTFANNANLFTTASGSRVTSVGGQNYFVTTNSDGRYISGTHRNVFGNATLRFGVLNGSVSYIDDGLGGGLDSLPSMTIVEVLENQGYTLFAAAITKTEKLTSKTGINTFITVSDAVFSAATGYTTVAEIEDLDEDDEDDAELIAELADIVDRHTLTDLYYSVDILADFPNATNLLDDEVKFFNGGADILIPIGPNTNNPTTFAVIISADIQAANGVIHESSEILDFE